MASIHKEIAVAARPDAVWAALSDYGGARELVPDLVKTCVLDGDARLITFVDGRVAREVLVGLDEGRWRLAYAEPGGRFLTRSASLQVFADGPAASRVVWINDVLLPDDYAPLIAANMEKGLASLKRTLEARQA
jgi:hypothetical protein